jgi:hypothetical protein
MTAIRGVIEFVIVVFRLEDHWSFFSVTRQIQWKHGFE